MKTFEKKIKEYHMLISYLIATLFVEQPWLQQVFVLAFQLKFTELLSKVSERNILSDMFILPFPEAI